MAEEKKDSFPWVQLIATIGTIMAALIGITPYLLKLNTSSAPSTPTIVIVTLPPAATTPAPVTTAETTAAATTATTGPPPGPALHIGVNTSSVLQGGFILVSGSTNPAVPQVTITLTNNTGFRSVAVPVALTQGTFAVQLGTSDYAPGDYAITAAVPDTLALATASFTIIPVGTPAPTTEVTTVAATPVATTMPATTATTVPATTNITTTATIAPTTINITTAATTVPVNTTTTV